MIYIPLRRDPFPVGYSALAQANTVVFEKAQRDVVAAVEHARACGCPTCYREANRTYGWYSAIPGTVG